MTVPTFPNIQSNPAGAIPVYTTTPPAGSGSSTYSNLALSSAPVAVKASPATLLTIDLYNPGTADAFVQMFNASVANVTLGTSVPNLSYWVPAGQRVQLTFAGGAGWTTALTIAATATDNGAGAPISALVVNATYV